MLRLCHVVLFIAAAAFAADDGRMRFDGASYPKLRVDEAGAFFESGYTPYLKITLGEKEFEALKKEPRKDVRCTVTEGEMVYRDVAIHLKGHASMRAITEKAGLTLKFNKFRPDQKFHSLDKLHLNNSAQDGTYLHEFAGSFVCRAAGVLAGRVTHARVDINGQSRGLYVLVEGFDHTMIRSYFTNWYGRSYDGAYLDDIHNATPQRSKNPAADKAALKPLITAAQEPDLVKRRQQLEAVLDIKQFMSVMAAESMISHWDGYASYRNNYMIYQDPTSGKFVFLTHDMDQIFGDPNFTLFPANGMLAKAMIDTPAHKREYLEHYQKLYRTCFHEDQLTNAVMQAAARMKLILEQIDPNAAKNALNLGQDVCRRISGRARGIERALAAELGLPWEPKPLRGWQSRTADGNPAFDEFKEGDKSRLRIRAGDKPAVGSWRVRVALPQGRYVFEARIRTVNVTESKDPQQGAGLRISGGPRRAGITGSTDWQKVEYEINADQGVTDVELVCELRATRGEAWFDTESLRVVSKEGNK
jgi:hypothetical protein